MGVWGSLAQRYVKRHGRSRQLDLWLCSIGQQMRSFKPSHGIGSEHGFPNTIYEHDFPGFSRDIRLISGCSQFLGFRNTTPFLSAEMILLRWEPPQPSGNRKARRGINIGENGGFQRVSAQSQVALRTFEQRNPSSSGPGPTDPPRGSRWSVRFDYGPLCAPISVVVADTA
jgi:hypothetical protein